MRKKKKSLEIQVKENERVDYNGLSSNPFEVIHISKVSINLIHLIS